jgi:ABC-type transporter Mla subunit MlaD
MSVREVVYDKPLKHLPEGKTIFDIHIEERLEYLDPNQDSNHPDLKLTIEEINKQFELNDPNRIAKEAQDKIDQQAKEAQAKIDQQQATIEQLIAHMAKMTDQMNALTQKINSN